MGVRLSRSLARLAAVGAGAWFAFWACAPPVALPPPVPFAADQSFEAGVAGMTGVALYRPDPQYSPRFYGGQGWLQFRLGEPAEAGVVLAASTTRYFAGGGFVRVRPLRKEHFTMGFQVEGGWLWGAVGMPVAFSPTPKIWLYTEPEIGFNSLGLLTLPVGTRFLLSEHLMLDLELGTAVGPAVGIDADYSTSTGYQPAYVGLGFAYRD